MDCRSVLFHAIVAAIVAQMQGSRCPPPCPMCPDIIPCSTPTCPVPKCPPLPDIPPCPVPRCPSLPEIPACPTPVLNLSCPNVTCPPQSCPPCPSCPNSPTCPPCSSPAPKPLPNGYTQVDGMGAYKFYSYYSSWKAANTTCSEDGAHLVIIDNKREMEALLNMMSLRSTSMVHVGFYDKYSNGNFATVFDQPMTREQKALWAPGEPNGYNFCVYLSKNYRKIADESCSDREQFVCEVAA